MKIAVSTKGQIVLPAEIRQQANIEASQVFEISPPRNQGLVDWLLACPEKDFFVPIESEAADAGEARSWHLPVATHILILTVTILLVGCNLSGPATTKTTSAAFVTVAERTKFLNEYVTFRRTYETLDFDVMYQNNGGLVSGPSDWDVRLVATVPASELQAWIPAGVKASATPDAAWLRSVPTTLDLSGVNEWYNDGERVVGMDRAKRIVVYRLSSI